MEDKKELLVINEIRRWGNTPKKFKKREEEKEDGEEGTRSS
jgi:hypothetical protein